MNLQYLVNTRYGTGAGLALGRVLPPSPGYALARFLANLAATRRQAAWLLAVRANQWVVSGQRLSAHGLDVASRDVLRHQTHCIFDLYHARRNQTALDDLVPHSRAMQTLIDRCRSGHAGALVVLPHLSNFDLVFIAGAHRGLRAQVLTFAHPGSGYRLQNRVRAVDGLEITPLSDAVTRQAVERLKSGGLVITAVDRPIEGKQHSLLFFGRPSPLPAGHVRMAMAAGVPVIPAGVVMQPNGRYALMLSEPLTMRPDPNPQVSIRQNAQAILDVLADYISQAPAEWFMYYPVWPEALAEMP